MDNEVAGTGNQYDYGFRIYNPRIAKFLSVDPLTRSYPMLTPYQFASNTPIRAIDLDGLEANINPIFWWYIIKDKVQRLVSQTEEGVEEVARGSQRLVHEGIDFDGGIPNAEQLRGASEMASGSEKLEKSGNTAGHLCLDVAGCVPVVGEGFDALNGLWYASEGKYASATVSLLSIVGLGEFGKGGKWIVKGSNFDGAIEDLGDALYAQFKHSDSDLPGLEFIGKIEVLEDDKFLKLTDASVFPIGVDKKDFEKFKNKYGRKILQYRKAVLEWAHKEGFEKVQFIGARVEGSTSANKGAVQGKDKIYDLKKIFSDDE